MASNRSGGPPDAPVAPGAGYDRSKAMRGNSRALKHGLTAAKDRRTRTDRRRELARYRAIVSFYRLGGDPIGEGMARALARIEREAEWAERYIERRGRVDAKGEPKPVWKLFLEKISPAGDAWRRALDMLQARMPETPSVVRIVFDDVDPGSDGYVAPPCARACCAPAPIENSPEASPSPPDGGPADAPERKAASRPQKAGPSPYAPDPWRPGLPGEFRGRFG